MALPYPKAFRGASLLVGQGLQVADSFPVSCAACPVLLQPLPVCAALQEGLQPRGACLSVCTQIVQLLCLLSG